MRARFRAVVVIVALSLSLYVAYFTPSSRMKNDWRRLSLSLPYLSPSPSYSWRFPKSLLLSAHFPPFVGCRAAPPYLSHIYAEMGFCGPLSLHSLAWRHVLLAAS